MKAILVRYPLASFFVMAFVFSWIAVMPLILTPGLPVEPFQILGALAGPTLSALIVMSVTEGKVSLGPFFRRYIQWKAGIGWWLLALFGILISLNLVAVVLIGPSILNEFIKNIGLILPTYLITLVIGVILGPLWEEPGWRGFALPRLQQRFHPVVACLILGAFWAVWHLPGYLGGWMASTFSALLAYCICYSIAAAWIYNHTRGSILLMIVLHSSSNAAISVGARVLPAAMPPGLHTLVYGGWIPAIMSAIAALLILVFTRGRLGFEGSRAPTAITETLPRTIPDNP